VDFAQYRRIDNNTRQIGKWTDPGSVSAQPMRDRRKPRHTSLFHAVRRLDAQIDTAARAELSRWVRDQYESEFGDVPLGFVARCYLGPPYVDHRLDLFQSIVDHYAPADAMPEPFAQARMLARTGAYEFIEVYASGQLCPVRADGTAVSS
jgi:hypothetical protein